MLTINCYNDSTGLPLADGTTVSIYHTTDTPGVSTPLITGVTVGGKFSSHAFFLAGGEYLATCSDNTYVNTLFYMYPNQLYTVINFLTAASQNSGGGGGGTPVVPSTQIVMACLADYYEDSGAIVASNTQSAVTQSDLICTQVLSGAGLGVDYNNSNAVQVTAFASAIPSTATNLRFEINVQINANITPPGSGGYPSNEIYQVQLYIVDVLNNLTVINDQNFSDIVQVTNTNQGNLYLSARYVAYTSTSVISGTNPYIDFLPQIASLSSGGDPLQVNDLYMQVEACVTAFKAVSS